MMALHRPQDPKDNAPANWSRFQQTLVCVAAFAFSVLLGWQLFLTPTMQRLENREQEERLLKSTYETKIKTTASWPSQQTQQSQMQQAIDNLQALQQHLAPSGDRDTVLKEIAVLARQHDLRLEFAKPGQAEMTTEYATHAVGIRLSGRYHDLGRFAADMTAMPQIVVLSNLHLSAAEDGIVVMDALAVTYQRLPTRDDHHSGENDPAMVTP